MDTDLNTEATIKAFDKQSIIFDELYRQNIIIQYKRERTRTSLEKHLTKGSSILELNAGTGDDALYFARKGYHVHATDLSEGMLYQLKNKIQNAGLEEKISVEKLSFTDLNHLTDQGPFDGVFSNFGGLNCANNLEHVLETFPRIVKKGGYITLVIITPFCLWEFMQVFTGNFRMAFRRLFSKKGAKARIEGVDFLCWYHKPSSIINYLKNDFRFVSLEGLCTIVPPSYIESFPVQHPTLYKIAKKLENSLKDYYPINRIGDYYILTLQKK
ncbi:class I SAM-dependent methyltransferase [Spirosoma gilvum]